MAPLARPVVALAALSVLVGVVGASVVWRRREARGARAYTLLLLVLALWSALYVGQLFGSTVGAKRPWLVARHAISPAVAVTFWVFAAQYTDSPGLLRPSVFGAIVGVGLILAPLPVLDPAGLYWGPLVLATDGPVPLLDVTFGPLFWAMIGYIAAAVAAGHLRIVSMSMESFAVYRRQLIALTVAGAGEFALLGLFLSEHVAVVPALNPFPNVQLITYSAVLMAIPLGWSYYRDALFGAQPLAYRTVVGNMEDAVFVLDTDGIVRNANEPAETMASALGTDALRGTAAETLFGDHPAIRDRYRRMQEADGDPDRESAPVRLGARGGERAYDVQASPIRNAGGGLIGTVLAFRDVTERTRQRERIERKNEQLERLAGVVSHDLRAPLSTAERTLSLVRRDLADPDPPVDRSLADLEATVEGLQDFADHLPQLARESVDVETTEACDLATVARRAWSMVDTGDLALDVAETRTLEADSQRLQRVFENLFSNAADHAAGPPGGNGGMHADGGPSVAGDASDGATAVNEQEPDADDVPDAADGGATGATTVRVGTVDGGVYVADDGPGIPPERRAAVFEYGVSTGDGSGFGLAIVRSIVEAHGWRVEATESPSGGARFEIHRS